MKKFLSLALAVIMCFALASCGCTEEKVTKDSYTVGVVQLIEHPALDAATQGFVDTLNKKMADAGKKVDIKVQTAGGDSTQCASIVNTYTSGNVDLIMANATAALQAAVAGTGDIPVLGTSITDYATALKIKDWTGTVGGNVSGTSDLAPLAEQAKMLVELCPKATKVGLLYCSAEPNSAYQVKVIKEELKKLNSKIVCTDYKFADTNDILAVTQKAAADSDVIYVPTDNQVASNTSIIDGVCLEAKVPVIAGEENTCKGCGVATLSIDYYQLGVKTGEMAAKILLEGADISKMAVETADAPTKKYDPARCEALGIEVTDDYVALDAEVAEEETEETEEATDVVVEEATEVASESVSE